MKSKFKDKNSNSKSIRITCDNWELYGAEFLGEHIIRELELCK